MGVNLDLSKVPPKTWIIVAIGIFVVCVGIAYSLMRRGYANLRYKPERKIEEMRTMEIRDGRGNSVIQEGYGSITVESDSDSMRVTKGHSN